VTCLPRTKDVENVLLADDGVFASAKKGTVISDTSTISPLASKEFSVKAKEMGLIFNDTPMTGGVMGAAEKYLTFYVGA